MINQIFFKSLKDLYSICIKAGFSGTYEDFLNMNMGQVFAYINIFASGDYTEH